MISKIGASQWGPASNECAVAQAVSFEALGYAPHG